MPPISSGSGGGGEGWGGGGGGGGWGGVGGGGVGGFKWKFTVCRLSLPWLIVREVGLMFNLHLPLA